MMFAALRPHFVALREASLHNNGVLVLHITGPGYDLTKPVTPEDFAAAGLPSPNSRQA